MQMRLLGIIGGVILVSAIESTVALASSFVYTDISNLWSSDGNTVTYALNVTLGPDNTTGSAVFTIQSSKDTQPPSYYAVEFDFKLVTGNHTPELSNLSTPSSTGPWSILDYQNANTEILKGNNGFGVLSAGAAGFAVESILYTDNNTAQPGSPDYTDGILVNGGDKTFQFSFDFDLRGGTFRNDGIVPYQAIFFGIDGPSRKFGQLSADLTGAPEPGSLILLSTGLFALGTCLWRRKK